MKTIKFLLVGDGFVGKTSLLAMYTHFDSLQQYTPTVLDYYQETINYQNKDYHMEIWDTAGQETYAELRHLAYSNVDIFLICFSIVEPNSYLNAQHLWYPEVRYFCPDSIVILVGTKMDLRDDTTTVQNLWKYGKSPISIEKGQELANKLNAYIYLECSALKKIGLKEIFDCGVLAYFSRKDQPPKKRKCTIL